MGKGDARRDELIPGSYGRGYDDIFPKLKFGKPQKDGNSHELIKITYKGRNIGSVKHKRLP